MRGLEACAIANELSDGRLEYDPSSFKEYLAEEQNTFSLQRFALDQNYGFDHDRDTSHRL